MVVDPDAVGICEVDHVQFPYVRLVEGRNDGANGRCIGQIFRVGTVFGKGTEIGGRSTITFLESINIGDLNNKHLNNRTI